MAICEKCANSSVCKYLDDVMKMSDNIGHVECHYFRGSDGNDDTCMLKIVCDAVDGLKNLEDFIKFLGELGKLAEQYGIHVENTSFSQ